MHKHLSAAGELSRRLERLYPEADPRVTEAMAQTPRDLFVSPAFAHLAYTDAALPIGFGQTISKPATVLRMLSAVSGAFGGLLLEVGSGSGYLAAVASRLFDRVVCVETVLGLVNSSRVLFDRVGIRNAVVHFGDGSLGWPALAPYDAVLYSAGAPSLPRDVAAQLKTGGLAGIPVGDRNTQTFTVLRKGESGMEENETFQCSFVPLVGKGGWNG
ncbi:MAG: protein-L-isoaspartate(D-aspartate) O-methyltransferase [Candidatus Fermentibacteraceae bacterium]